MNRRGFLGSLAALVGAKVVADRLPPDEPTVPVVRNGYLQVVNADLNNISYTITTNASTGNIVYLNYEEHMRGEGRDWSYTALR